MYPDVHYLTDYYESLQGSREIKLEEECPECGDDNLVCAYCSGDGGCLDSGWYGRCDTCGIVFYSRMKPGKENVITEKRRVRRVRNYRI